MITRPVLLETQGGEENRRHTEQDFWTGFTEQQKDAVRAYLMGVRSMLRESVHLSELYFIDEAQLIWGRR